MTMCEVPGCDNEATTKSVNPDWSGYEMCQECAAEYDSRKPLICDSSDNER